MGMFDTIIIECPECGADIEYQTKVGKCELEKYEIGLDYISYQFPPEVAVSLNLKEFTCNCGTIIKFYAEVNLKMIANSIEARRRKKDAKLRDV